MTLRWRNTSEFAQGYVIERADEPSFEWVQIATLPVDSTSFADLLSRRRYHVRTRYRVTAFAIIDGDTRKSVSIENALDVRYGVTITPVAFPDESTLHVAWSDTVAFGRNVEIELRVIGPDSTSDYVSIGTFPSGHGALRLEYPLINRRSYQVRARSTTDDDASEYYQARPEQVEIFPPSFRFAQHISENRVAFAIDHHSFRHRGYVIERRSENEPAFSQIAALMPNTHSFIDDTLEPTKTYKYRIGTLSQAFSEPETITYGSRVIEDVSVSVSGSANLIPVRHSSSVLVHGYDEMLLWNYVDNVVEWRMDVPATSSSSTSLDREVVVMGDFSGTVRVWNVRTGALVQSVRVHHANRISAVAISPDKQLLAASVGADVHIYRLNNEEYMFTITIDGGFVESLAFTISGSHLAIGLSAEPLHFYDLEVRRAVLLRNTPYWARGMEATPDGTRLIVANFGRLPDQAGEAHITIYNLEHEAIDHWWRVHDSGVRFSVSADGSRIAFPAPDNEIQVRRISDGTVVNSLKIPVRETSAAIGGDNTTIITGRTGNARTWKEVMQWMRQSRWPSLYSNAH